MIKLFFTIVKMIIQTICVLVDMIWFNVRKTLNSFYYIIVSNFWVSNHDSGQTYRYNMSNQT